MARRALISVSDKTGVVEFAKGLAELGFEILSTGGTFNAIKEAGVPVMQVAEATGFPEILDGRVKTLHPKIHGGLLARRALPEHMAQLKANGIETIDVVAVNLYPFRATISKPNVTLEDAIENIDIGGPTMVRSAAKNYQDVAIIVNPAFYPVVLAELKEQGEVSAKTKFDLACQAFRHTAAYDAMVSTWLSRQNGELFPESIAFAGEKVYDLRYGENPHQKACFYRNVMPGSSLCDAEQLNGKEMSYNNIIDTQAAWSIVKEFEEPACVIIKHTNPCGTAIGANLKEAYMKAFEADSVSAFGGIIAVNRKVDLAAAEEMAKPFMEVIIAPDYDADALAKLSEKKNVRVLKLEITNRADMVVRVVEGGFAVQEEDTELLDKDALKVVTVAQPTPEQMEELLFAWKVVKHVKSNAIVVSKDKVAFGVGAGQMNRVGSAKIALEDAERCKGAVLASDAFFPFGDTVEEAAKNGIAAVIQPGGSIRDQESIDACNKYGIPMVFTGMRHFRH